MRKAAATLTVALAAGAIAVVPALAQQPETSVKVTGKITPKKTGTKKNPRGVTFSGTATWKTVTQGVEPPIITGATVFLPKQGKLNGGKYPKCSKATLKKDDGLELCPKKSIMGSAKGEAFADTVKTKPDIVFVNGGAKLLHFYTTLYHPAFVQEPVEATIKKVSHPKWGYRMVITVPENLQVVAGVPIALTKFTYKVGGKPYAKDFIATTGCPKSKKAPFQVTTFYLYNDGSRSNSTSKSSIACS